MPPRKKSPAPYAATRTPLLLDSDDFHAAIAAMTVELERELRTLCQVFARKALEDALGGPVSPSK